jgi:FAD synthase
MDKILTGKVQFGNGVDSKFRYPTANIKLKEIPDWLIDEYYIGNVDIDTMIYKCAFIHKRRYIENVDREIHMIYVHLFNFNDDLYDRNITIHNIESLPDESVDFFVQYNLKSYQSDYNIFTGLFRKLFLNDR